MLIRLIKLELGISKIQVGLDNHIRFEASHIAMAELSVVFAALFAELKDADYSSFSAERISSLLEQALACIDLVRREAIFSGNEELDDIQTESLKVCYDLMLRALMFFIW